jgi:hypothetical protein
MHDHVTLLSPARIERGIARDNSTPILSRTRSSGFNVFGLRMGLRSTGLKASEHGGSDARAAGCQSRSGVPYRHPPNLPGSRALSCASVHPLSCTLDICLPTSSDPTSCQLPSGALLDRSLVARFFERDFAGGWAPLQRFACYVNLADERGDGRFDAACSLVYWTPITRWRPNSRGESLPPNWAGRRAARNRRP